MGGGGGGEGGVIGFGVQGLGWQKRQLENARCVGAGNTKPSASEPSADEDRVLKIHFRSIKLSILRPAELRLCAELS